MRLFFTITVATLVTVLLSAPSANAGPPKPSVTAISYKDSLKSGPVRPPANDNHASWTPVGPYRSLFDEKRAPATPNDPANSHNDTARSSKAAPYIKFKDFYLFAGCHNDQYHSPNCATPCFYACYKNCPLWSFTIDIPPFKEFCLYHDGIVDVTTCVKFNVPVQKQDVNYFLNQIINGGLFDFISPFGISTWAWAQGWVVAPDDTFLAYSISLQRGRHGSLGTTLGPYEPYVDEWIKTPHTGRC